MTPALKADTFSRNV